MMSLHLQLYPKPIGLSRVLHRGITGRATMERKITRPFASLPIWQLQWDGLTPYSIGNGMLWAMVENWKML